MSKNITKVIAGLGIVAGLGAAMLPLGSYAATEATTNLQVTVGGSLSLALEAGTNTLNLNANAVDTSTMTDTLVATTNNSTGYKILANTVTANNAMIGTTSGTNTIPAMSGSSLTAGTAGWGLKTNGAFSAVPAQGASGLEVKNSGSAAYQDRTTVTYGVATSTTQAADTYKVSVKYVISNNG